MDRLTEIGKISELIIDLAIHDPVSIGSLNVLRMALECQESRKEISELKKELEERGAGEKVWRELLWLRHGCQYSSLYGDDGEMQCSKCAIDFRRMSPQHISDRWTDASTKALREHFSTTNPKGSSSSPQS